MRKTHRSLLVYRYVLEDLDSFFFFNVPSAAAFLKTGSYYVDQDGFKLVSASGMLGLQVCVITFGF